MAVINISDGNSTFSLWTDNDSGLTLENLKSAYPDAINLINPVYEPRRLLSVRDGKIYNPGGWDTNIVYLAHLGSSRPPTPIVSRPKSSVDARPESPYPEAPSPPPPMSKSIDKWMFYAVDSAGKSTVVCIHPRYFVTFRHGTHLQLQVGSVIRIFHAKSETNEQDGYEVTVVDLDEMLDFILLRSKEIIVPKAPRLAKAEESENFLQAVIRAFPYTVPSFLQEILITICRHANEREPIRGTMKKALNEFKRTHQDMWAQHKQEFNEDQLAILTSVLVSPNYYV